MHLCHPPSARIKHRRTEHPQQRCGEVNPECGKLTGAECRRERACGVLAETGKRGFKDNVRRHQQSAEKPGVRRQPCPIRRIENDAHRKERDGDFSAEGHGVAVWAWDGSGKAHSGIPGKHAGNHSDDQDAGNAAQKLCCHVGSSIASVDLAQPQECQCNRRIHVRPGAAAKRRVDQ